MCGVLCAMTTGMTMMLKWSADSFASLPQVYYKVFILEALLSPSKTNHNVVKHVEVWKLVECSMTTTPNLKPCEVCLVPPLESSSVLQSFASQLSTGKSWLSSV